MKLIASVVLALVAVLVPTAAAHADASRFKIKKFALWSECDDAAEAYLADGGKDAWCAYHSDVPEHERWWLYLVD